MHALWTSMKSSHVMNLNHAWPYFLRCIAQTGLGKGLWRDLGHPLVQAAHQGELSHQAAGQAHLWNQASSITGQAGCSLATVAVVHQAPREWTHRQASQGPPPFHGQQLREAPVMSRSTAAWSFCPWVAVKGNDGEKKTENGIWEAKREECCLRLCKWLDITSYLSTVPLGHPIIP